MFPVLTNFEIKVIAAITPLGFINWNKNLSTVTALTLSTVDSSRILEVDPTRSVETSKVNMNPIFSSWRTKSPDNPIVDVDAKKSVEILNEERYSFYKRMRHLGTFLIPGEESLVYNGAFTDALGQHTFGAAVIKDSTLNSVFFQYQNLLTILYYYS